MRISAHITVRTPAGEEILDLEDFEARLERGEIDPATEINFPPVTGPNFVRAGEVEAFRERYEPRALYFARAFSLGRIPALTIVFSLGLLAFFLLQRRAGIIDPAAIVAFGGKAGPLLHDLGQTWRLLTANLVHRDWTHLGFNLFVLFHFGAAVENAYRPLDWLLVVVASALGTTLLSYAMTDALSAGASGVAYGMLGAALIFGLKYRRILPERYRSVLGSAVVPTLILLLYVGFTSSGVDNWGHVGGLLAGAAATWPLQPRLLGDSPRRRQVLLRRILPLSAVIASTLLAAAILPSHLPSMRTLRDDALGIELPIPTTWQGGAVDGAELVYSNGMQVALRASIAASVRLVDDGYDLDDEAQRFLSAELYSAADARRIEDVVVRPIQYAYVGGLLGVLVESTYRDNGVPVRLGAHLFVRGNLLYQIVVVRPRDLPAYDRVFEKILAGVHVVEPAFARAARERADENPRDAKAWMAAGDAAMRIGDPTRARMAYERAEALDRDDPGPPAARARVAFEEGLPREGCRLARRARGLGESVAVRLALSRCAMEQGDVPRALEHLEAASELEPRDELLRRRLERLRTQLR